MAGGFSTVEPPIKDEEGEGGEGDERHGHEGVEQGAHDMQAPQDIGGLSCLDGTNVVIHKRLPYTTENTHRNKSVTLHPLPSPKTLCIPSLREGYKMTS